MAIRNVPLHPDALITQEDADALDALLDAYEAANDDLITKREALDDFYALHALDGQALSDSTGIDHAPDLFGDGTMRPFDQLSLCPGLQPRWLSRRSRRTGGSSKPVPADVRARSEHGQSNRRAPGVRRRPDAVVPVGIMIQADQRSDDVNAALLVRRDAALDLNKALNALMRPAGIEFPSGDIVVDVFGDGLVKPIHEVQMPAFLSLIRKRGEKMVSYSPVENVLEETDIGRGGHP